MQRNNVLPMSRAAKNEEIQNTLKRWHLEAEVAQRFCTSPGLALKEQLLGLSGMEFFAAMMNGEVPPPYMTATSTFGIVEFDYGYVLMQGTPLESFQNTLGIIHGGWIATILDSVVGCAVHSTLAAGMGYATAELKVSFLRPLNVDIGLIRAEGKIISVGKKIAFAEGTLFGPDGKNYAHATTTCAVFPGTA